MENSYIASSCEGSSSDDLQHKVEDESKEKCSKQSHTQKQKQKQSQSKEGSSIGGYENSGYEIGGYENSGYENSSKGEKKNSSSGDSGYSDRRQDCDGEHGGFDSFVCEENRYKYRADGEYNDVSLSEGVPGGILERPGFTLDMVSMDMDFEQAYSMYASSQHRQSMGAVDPISKVQALSGQASASGSPSHGTDFGLGGDVLLGLEGDRFGLSRSHAFSGRNGGKSPAFGDVAGAASTSMGLPGSNGSSNRNYSYMGFSDESLGSAGKNSGSENDDFDKFFSNTESNALERFLDNLTSSNNTNPLQLYNTYGHRNIHSTPDLGGMTAMYELHTMKPTESSSGHDASRESTKNGENDSSHNMHNGIGHSNTSDEHENLKRELTDAFSHPPMKTMKGVFDTQNQLPTPTDTRHSSSYAPMSGLVMDSGDGMDNHSDKRLLMDDSSLESSPNSHRKRRRSTHKPLLSLEQKRLNHSHSEQKRRQLCKSAYERCLRLIVDVEKYNSAPDTNRKSKRARITKNGLPNLSKHTALMKISNEITKIKSKNDRLRKLISDSTM